MSHFPRFLVFSPKSRSYSVYFSYFKFFTVSGYIPGPTVCVSFCLFFRVSCNISCPIMWVSHFPRFSEFLTTFHVLPCEFLIFLLCQFSRHIPDPKIRVSHFPFWSVFTPYSRSYIVHFSFSTFLSVSRHIPGQIVFVSHFPCFPVFCNIPGPTMCFSHF